MLVPTEDNILVIQDKAKEKTKGGIILPDQSQEQYPSGTIVDVGDEVEDLQPGDKIWFPKYGGNVIKYGEKEYLVMRKGDVLAYEEREA